MERACLQRDATYDGIFFIGVRTTGIFCRPTCPARKPLPRNVEYYATAREALVAGYRPCKRCRPMDSDGQPGWVKELLADVERRSSARITDGDLRERGIDPATARRYFMRHYGMTFQAYTRARRLGQALNQIREGAVLDDVVFESGYESHSGFRDAFVRAFRRPPGRSRDYECVYLTWIKSPLGPLVAGATSEGVCLLEFTDRRMLETQLATVRRVFKFPIIPGRTDHLSHLERELSGYFAGSVRQFSVPLVFPDSPFQRCVWEELLRIPYGETRSYEQLAVATGSPKAQRAVGRANGLNRIAIVIPCHRVVNKDGQLGGYGGGLRRKQYLLELERSNRATANHPTASTSSASKWRGGAATAATTVSDEA
jgi:AraC family transcriptional regulator of adaptative response/methylated-DNA-[protein]-cysteine methyltransferase